MSLQNLKSIIKEFHKVGLFCCFFGNIFGLMAQAVQWSKVYQLSKEDKVTCITRDDNYVYAGGYTFRNAFYFNTTPFYKAVIIKLDFYGDTIFIKDLGVSGEVQSIAVDPYGNIRANVKQYYIGANGYNTFLFQLTPEGLNFKTDTIAGYPPTACVIGKDSSLVIVGYKNRTGFTGQTSMYFKRITKEGIIEPWVELNPGHPDCRANKVEQLPNGNYLVSGYVGSRAASFELKANGSNPVYHQWYQTPDLSNLDAGYIGRVGNNNWMVAGQGGPAFAGIYDSVKTKIWMKKEVGFQAPPQAMLDGSMVFGYTGPIPPFQYFYRFKSDSSLVWFFNVKDSLVVRSLNGFLDIYSFTYFDDESAIFAGNYRDDSSPNNTKEDPIFLRIANVGTPVTSLSKPKIRILSNETLAPWPNPTGGTLYLKQHFDKADIHFYNISGKAMGSYKINFAQSIDISTFPKGIYLYRSVIDGKAYSGKVIRN